MRNRTAARLPPIEIEDEADNVEVDNDDVLATTSTATQGTSWLALDTDDADVVIEVELVNAESAFTDVETDDG